MAILLIEVHVTPSVHPLVNVVNCGIKIAIFLVLAFSTAFVDVEAIDIVPHRRPFGILLLVLFPIMAALTVWCVLKALYKRYVVAQEMVAVQQACNSRFAMFHIACLPEKELVDKVTSISDAEAAEMRECSDMLTSIFFSQQPSDAFWAQRIIATGEPFKVADLQGSRRMALEAISKRRLQAVMEANAEVRYKTRQLLKAAAKKADERGQDNCGPVMRFIFRKCSLHNPLTGFLTHIFPESLIGGARPVESDGADNGSADDVVAALTSRSSRRISRLMSETTSDRIVTRASTIASAHGIEYVGEHEFVEELRGVSGSISDDDLRNIFRVADLSGTGVSRVCDIVTLMRLACYEDRLSPQRSTLIDSVLGEDAAQQDGL